MTQFIKYKNDGGCVFIVNISEIISFEPNGNNVKLTERTVYGSGTHELPVTMDDLISQMENGKNDMIINIDCSGRVGECVTYHDFSPIVNAVVIRQHHRLTSEEANKPVKRVILQRDGRDSDAIHTTNINKVGIRQDGLLQFNTFACNHDPIIIDDYDRFVIKLKELIKDDRYAALTINWKTGEAFLIKGSELDANDPLLMPDVTIEPLPKLIRVEWFNNTHNTPRADGANLLRQIKKVFYGEQGEVKHHIPECNINRLEFYDDETMKFIAFHGEYPAIYVENIEKVLSKLRTLKNEDYHISLTIKEDGDCFLTQDAAGIEMIARDRGEEDAEFIIE